MTNIIDYGLPLAHLLYDIALDIVKKENMHRNDVYDVLYEKVGVDFKSEDVEKIERYIKAKKSVYKKYKSSFHDKSDIILLEMIRIRNRGFKLNEIPF